MAALLLLPAIANGFPLVFPDSGTYLGIATGHDYAIDRSSVYGLLLRPFARLVPGLTGLWLAMIAQALGIAGALWLVAQKMTSASPLLALCGGAALIALTALPWHAGQIMPDALTGPLVLLACLAATRSPSTPGSPLLWLALLVLAMTHYTHVVLLAATAGVAILAQVPLGLARREALVRLAATGGTVATAIMLLTVANAVILKRPAMSPTGAVFLFARLNADGLASPWLDRHCGVDAPPALCAERRHLTVDSQTLLWGDGASPVGRHIWHGASEEERWAWVDMLAAANRGIVAEQPLAFLRAAARGTARQLLAFRAIDDECPAGCGRNPASGMAYILARDRAAALPALLASAQLRGTTPKAIVRAITTPIAAVSLMLLPLAPAWAWRRRDRAAFAFTTGILAAILANAALAGALSDVHDRYQSRIVWLAPALLLLLLARSRACPARRQRP